MNDAYGNAAGEGAGVASASSRFVAGGGATAAVTFTGFQPLPANDRHRLGFTAAEWVRIAGFYGVIVALHVGGWGLFLYYSSAYPAMIGLGLAAYLFGLRHAFDVDHIAAVDDTVRFMLQKGRKPLGVGFFFALGHSTIVLLLSVALALGASAVTQAWPSLQSYGGVIGAGVSGTFLWFIGVLNLLLLLDMLRVWRRARSATHSHAHLDELLAQRGLLNRLFGGRIKRFINHSWQMYPLGLLFGLGFDTASEVALLSMTAGAALGNLPLGAALSLPVLFAAGMCMMDTTDGVLMVKAYNWTFVNPVRRIFYSVTTTSLSVALALVIGTLQLVQAGARLFHIDSPVIVAVAALNSAALGGAVVAIFLVAWAASVIVLNRGDAGNPAAADSIHHRHTHRHDGGVSHSHQHFH